MNTLDLILLALVLAYAVSGYWQGFVTGAFATVGLLLGGLFGVWVAPRFLGEADPSVWVSLGALFVVLLGASFGQALLQLVGSRLRDQITWQPVRALDAVGGAVLNVAAVLVVTWVLGVAITGARLPWISPEVRESQVLAKVDEVMPDRAVGVLDAFNEVVGTSFFPRYLMPFASERIVAVGAPPAAVARDPEIAAAQASVVKLHGENECGRGVEGSGFLYSPDRIMTNAHVVAGVDSPRGVAEDGRETEAEVVYFDADLDIAVLAVDGLGAPHLAFDLSGKPRQAGAVLGYPQDGPYDVQPARIRSVQRLRSPDHQQGAVIREVFSLRSLIRPGNSGGPLVDEDGEVLGVVFAASLTDDETGYALTADQVAQAAARGLTSSTEVDTGGCP